ncbi:MAG: hypothetical protein DWH71_05140 [Planctomycetota bacterium]|nr:MAG: hypothetical protein DWH71_05140 [Planctomycetota bacterium]
MTALVARLHRWIGERMATRAARILATLAILISLALVTWPLLNTAFSLQTQRAGILKSLEKCSAKDRDPAAMQLMQRGTVTVGDREYGGARVVGRAVDLFDDAGVMPADVKQELSWRLLGDQVPLWMPYVLVRSPALVIALMLVTGIGALAVVWIGLLLPALEVGGAVAAQFCAVATALCVPVERCSCLVGLSFWFDCSGIQHCSRGGTHTGAPWVCLADRHDRSVPCALARAGRGALAGHSWVP